MKRAVARGAVLCVLALAVSLTAFGQKGIVEKTTLVIEGGTLIDGSGRVPIADAVIVIEENRIVAVGEKGRVSVPAGARRLQAGGKFILPGMSDIHVHWADWMPELFLAHGVTSAVDLDTINERTLMQKDALADGRLRGPRLFTTTPSLSGRLLWDLRGNQEVAETVEMARRIVRRIGPGRGKYNLTKAYTELTPDQLQAIVEESHKAGRNVIAHLGSLDARQAAELGVDGLAHGSGIALATISDPVKAEELRTVAKLGIAVDYPMFLMYHAFMDPAKVDTLVALLVQKNVRVEFEQVNTSGRWVPKYKDEWLAEDTRLLRDPNLQYIPSENGDRVKYYKPWEGLDSQQRDLVSRGYENRKSFIRKFVQAGGKVLAGCDTASFVLPGICIHRELELLVEAGLSPMQAIQAATKNNFEFLQESDLGTIEPGKLADLIILRANPLANIRNTRTIDVVIKDGEVMDTHYHADFVNPVPRAPVSGGSAGFVHPTPSIRVIYPMTSKDLNKDVTLIIEGNNLIDESSVEFDGVELAATPVKTTMLLETAYKPVYTQVAVAVPSRLLSRFGSYKVTVKNPKPQGGISNVLNFFIAQ